MRGRILATGEISAMNNVNEIEVTLYLVGEDKDDAMSTFPFDSFESAEGFWMDQEDNSNLRIYSVSAILDLSTLEEI